MKKLSSAAVVIGALRVNISFLLKLDLKVPVSDSYLDRIDMQTKSYQSTPREAV